MSCRKRIALLRPFTPSAIWWHAITPHGLFGHVHGNLFRSGTAGYAPTGNTPHWPFMAFLVDAPYGPDTDTRSIAAGYNQ
jgi:hypothetical protein